MIQRLEAAEKKRTEVREQNKGRMKGGEIFTEGKKRVTPDKMKYEEGGKAIGGGVGWERTQTERWKQKCGRSGGATRVLEV